MKKWRHMICKVNSLPLQNWVWLIALSFVFGSRTWDQCCFPKSLGFCQAFVFLPPFLFVGQKRGHRSATEVCIECGRIVFYFFVLVVKKNEKKKHHGFGKLDLSHMLWGHVHIIVLEEKKNEKKTERKKSRVKLVVLFIFIFVNCFFWG